MTHCNEQYSRGEGARRQRPKSTHKHTHKHTHTCAHTRKPVFAAVCSTAAWLRNTAVFLCGVNATIVCRAAEPDGSCHPVPFNPTLLPNKIQLSPLGHDMMPTASCVAFNTVSTTYHPHSAVRLLHNANWNQEVEDTTVWFVLVH